MIRPFVLAAAACIASAPLLAQREPLDSALHRLEADGFSGVVRVEKNGAVLLEKGYGLADRAGRVPFSPSTVVQIGSNTKDFTVVALLQLHERKRLDIHDSLAKFFPNAPADKRNITLWQLVTHVAGFPIGLGGDFEAVSRDEFLARAFARPLDFAPGSREQYSNTGYALLAAVIEVTSGTSYDQFVRDNILAPLGLTHTGLLLPGFDPKSVAHGYRNGEDQGTMLARPHAADGPYWNLRGNGGMLSTVDDMHAFYKALFETDKLLRPATRALRFNADEPIGLAGSDLVNFFLYERLPRAGIEIIVATNSAELRAPLVRRTIGAVLGLPSPDGGPNMAAATPATMIAPSAAVATLANGFIEAVNSGDAGTLTAFIASHFVIESGTPTAAQRAERLVGMHRNLGLLTVRGMNQLAPNELDLLVTSANEGPATLKLAIEQSNPPKITSLQVLVGG